MSGPTNNSGAPEAQPAPRFEPHGLEFLNALVESTTDAVYAKDLDGRYTIINTAGARFLSRPVDEVLGRTDAELLPVNEARKTMEADRRVVESGRTLTYEVREQWAGVWREWRSTKGVLRDATGVIVGVFGVSREISAQRKTEQALARSEQLAAVGTLAAGVAHEINNPLASVCANLAYVDAELRRSPRNEPPLEALLTAVSEARDGAERVRSIVQDLLAGAHADGQAVRPMDANVAIERAIAICIDSLRRDVRVVRDLDPLPWIVADERQLVQVLVNILRNANQAAPQEPGREHEIRISSRGERGEVVVIEIRDNGVGIAPEHLNRVFEPFFTTKLIGEGTGLGLSIADRIVRSMGGSLDVESRLGSGTCVRVQLPVSSDTPRPAAERHDSVPREAALRRARVLVIDDEVHLVSALSRYFAHGHELTACGDASSALLLLATGARFDVILCDLMMPGMSGAAFHDVLSARDPRQAARVVLATGGVTPPEHVLAQGESRRCLRKPFDLPALEALLDASALDPLED